MKASDLILGLQRIIHEGKDPIIAININGKGERCYLAWMLADTDEFLIISGGADYEKFMENLKKHAMEGEYITTSDINLADLTIKKEN